MRRIEAVATSKLSTDIYHERWEIQSCIIYDWFDRFVRSCSSISPGNQAAAHFCGGISGRDQSSRSGSRKQSRFQMREGEKKRGEGNADEEQRKRQVFEEEMQFGK